MNTETLITGIVSAVIGGLIVYAITKNIPKRAYNWIKYHKISKNIIFKILPEKVINVPVDGRELTLVLSNRNRNFDIEMKIILEFPDFLEIHKSSNFSLNNEFGFQMDYETSYEAFSEERVSRKFEKKIQIVSMSEWRTTFKLLPKDYGKSGNIIYKVSLGVKDLEGKIRVNT